MVIINNLQLRTSFTVLTVQNTMEEKSVQKVETLGKVAEVKLQVIWRGPRWAQVSRPLVWGQSWPGMSLISSVDIPFINVNDIYLLKAVTTVKESHWGSLENPGCYFIISIVYRHTGRGSLSNRFNSAAKPWQAGYILNTLELWI